MRLSLRARQVTVVTTLAVFSTLVLAGVYLTSLIRLGLEEDRARGELLARSLFHRARVVVAGAEDPAGALRSDDGLRAILESSIAYTQNVTYAVIVDAGGVAIAHSSPTLEGTRPTPAASLIELLETGPLGQLQGVFRDPTLEIVEPMQLGEDPFGSIRVGLSTVLIRDSLGRVIRPAAIAVVITLAAGIALSLLLAQWALKPIHVIKAGLNQLGQGASGVRLALPPGADLTDVGESFDAISTRLAAQAPNAAQLESVVEHLEDAVAILDTRGELLFANSAMTDTLPVDRTPACFVDDSLPDGHPYRELVAEAVEGQRTIGPVSVEVASSADDGADAIECEVTAHAFRDSRGEFTGLILVSRRAIGLMRSVESTIETSRQLAELGQLLTGVGHEVKNPLNAMAIHLELLRQKLGRDDAALFPPPAPRGSVLGLAGSAGDTTAALAGGAPAHVAPPAEGGRVRADVMQHVTILEKEVRRLDGVIQGFLRFIKPDELVRETVGIPELVDEVVALMRPEAERIGASLDYRGPPSVPVVMGDRAMLRQALLNLALNAIQAVDAGGRIRIGVSTKKQWVQIDVEDNGPGMPPEVLQRAFQLYYTTKPKGSGIGLSMVFRITQLHGGTIDIESTVGTGTRVRLRLPEAGYPSLKTAWETEA